MVDEIYEQCVAAEEAFNAWWREHCPDRSVPGYHMESKALAQAAWRKAWGAALNARNKSWFVDSEELRMARQDVVDIETLVDAARPLAKRYGLVIQSVGSPEKGKVEATKNGTLVVTRYGWREMVAKLKAMEERGEL